MTPDRSSKSTLLKLAGAVLAVAMPASQASAERIFGLASGSIVTFDSAAPGVITSSRTITGVANGDTLVGLDMRPATRTLYSVGTSGNLYALTLAAGGTYAATSVGVIAPQPAGSSFGIDFNPVPDRLRLISDTNQNLRINPANGATITDTAITLNGSNNVDIIASAYTNSRAGAATTTLFGLDSRSDSLLRSTNANAGTYEAVGPLGFSFSVGDRVAFDISGLTSNGFFSIGDNFYSVNLATGAGAFIGGVGVEGLSGLTAGAVPEPASWAMLIAGFGLVGAAMRRRTATTGAAMRRRNPAAVAA